LGPTKNRPPSPPGRIISAAPKISGLFTSEQRKLVIIGGDSLLCQFLHIHFGPRLQDASKSCVRINLNWSDPYLTLSSRDSRIPALIRNGLQEKKRSVFVVVGDRSKEVIVHLHYILSSMDIQQKNKAVLWAYKTKLIGFTR
jgi:hypothetical protein